MQVRKTTIGKYSEHESSPEKKYERFYHAQDPIIPEDDNYVWVMESSNTIQSTRSAGVIFWFWVGTPK